MRLGPLRHRVSFQEAYATENSVGEETICWQTKCAKWASIKPFSGVEDDAADAIEARVTHKIRVRWFAGLSARMRISYRDRFFNIVEVLNFEERNHFVDIMAIEVIGAEE